ncbi:MAG: 3-dehydroquinate synthase [Acutalibacteraceae bacterium]|nr:3-dehydroquinate synthase [Clostridia bacterium]MEE3450255.1 3-dehydroquinate synthase [Acutalibacteraceae bacterium]
MSVFNVELIKTVDDSYQIETGYDLAQKLVEDLKNGLVGNISKFAVITDDIVKNLYADNIANLLSENGFNVKVYSFKNGEKSKTRATKEYIEDAMLADGLRRDCCIIAVGGGVVTDIAGFIAGTYGRGVPFINYATTLLAAADASVGGKTAVDTPLATNLIGIFNQPKKVYIDIAAWATLEQRQLYSGMAETIKHACLADREMFDYIAENIDKIYSFDKEACNYIAEKNCRIKYSVVMKDERESGLREILNLGHTVGRAAETVSGYKLLHGEAVSIGLCAQAKLSQKMGYMTAQEVEKTVELLKKACLPVTLPEYIDKAELVKKLYTDKKVRNGKLRFVLQNGIGDVVRFGENVYATPVSEDIAREIINML